MVSHRSPQILEMHERMALQNCGEYELNYSINRCEKRSQTQIMKWCSKMFRTGLLILYSRADEAEAARSLLLEKNHKVSHFRFSSSIDNLKLFSEVITRVTFYKEIFRNVFFSE